MKDIYTLQTKSIQAPATPDDGIRVCVMRRVKPEFIFDIWLPHLAASSELLKNYQDNLITWDNFVEIYQETVIHKEQLYILIIKELLMKKKVTLLCWEETSEKCHRRLLAEHIASVNKKISLKIA